MPGSPEQAFDREAFNEDVTKQKAKGELRTVEQVQVMTEKEKQEVWRQTIELDIVASERSLELFSQEVERLRDKLGQSATRDEKDVQRFRFLSRAKAEKIANIDALKHVAGLYDEAAWNAKLAEAKTAPDLSDERWQAVEAEAREFATRRAAAEAEAWEDAEWLAREYAGRRQAADQEQTSLDQAA